jgi:hypothetical protein
MPTIANLGGQGGGSLLGFGGKLSSGLSSSTFSDIGGVFSDLAAASGFKTKAAGLRVESEEYLQAAAFADLNEKYTEQSTAVQEAQASRSIEKTLGQQQADVAANNFEEAGSALDLLRDSATQGALQKAVLQQQGLITEAGYEQQAASYRLMSSAADMAAGAADRAAKGAQIDAYIKGAAAIVSVLPAL